MALSTAQFLAIADNVAKTLLDLETTFITNPGSVSPTVTTISNGQTAASNSLGAHIGALSASDQQGQMGQHWITTANTLINYATALKNELYVLYAPFLAQMDTDLGNTAEFISTNALVVHAEFANAFNYMAGIAVAQGLRPVEPTPILPNYVFAPATEILGSVAVTGAAAGTFTVGTPISNLYVSSQLYLKNTAGVATVGTATSFTVTYTNAAGTTGQTVTQALSGALAAGATLAAGAAIGQAVSNIVVNSGGVAADAIAVVVLPARTVTY